MQKLLEYKKFCNKLEEVEHQKQLVEKKFNTHALFSEKLLWTQTKYHWTCGD